MTTQNMIESAYSATPTASTISQWDANVNMSANAFIPAYATTVTAAALTTLTVSSPQQQYFTGSTTQTVKMPVTSTLVLGQNWSIVNNSTGAVTIESSGANTILVLPASSETVVTCILTSGTTAASWTTSPAVSGSGTVNSGLINQLAYYAAAGTAVSGLTIGDYGVLISSSSGVPSWLANGTTGQILTATTSGTPSWAANPGRLIGIQVFTSSGSNTYTPSAGVNNAFVELWGAGGGGGSSASATLNGSGGGGGAYSAAFVAVSGNVTISIGAGGAGQAQNSGTAGTAGGNTTYNSTTVVAVGGGYGGNGGATVPGAGGAAGSCTGTIKISGGTGNQGNGGVTNLVPGGGSSPRNIPIPAITGLTGAAPANSGGGGAAGNNTNAGGAGGSGYAVVWEYS